MFLRKSPDTRGANLSAVPTGTPSRLGIVKKAVHCTRCDERYTLTTTLKTCSCGGSKGILISTMYAQYSGEFANPIGVTEYDPRKHSHNNLLTERYGKKGEYIIIRYTRPTWCFSKNDQL